jgi:hypothetical protein
MKKRLLFLIIIFLLSSSIFSVDYDSENVALRYSQIANSYLLDENFSEALKNAEYGLNYNSGLSDLYFIKAKALDQLNNSKFEVIENVETAYKLNNYREINAASVKTFYAKLLCETTRPAQALTLLETKPVVFSSETEYIKALALYRLGKRNDARKVIDSARKIFTETPIFCELFFTWENPSTVDKNLLAVFLKNIDAYANKNPKLFVLASKYVSDKDNKFLFKYNEAAEADLEFLCECLKKQIIFSEFDALNKIRQLTQKEFPLNYILEFNKLFHQVSDEYKKYIDSYTGIILQDFYTDKIYDTFIYTKEGLTDKIESFNLQDGRLFTLITFSNDKINSIAFPQINLNFNYSDYPYISDMFFSNGEKISTVPYEVSEDLVFLEKENNFYALKKLNFSSSNKIINENYNLKKYLSKISSFKTPLSETSFINFHLLDGTIINADYYSDNLKIAYAVFEKGIPVFRNIDKNNDGLFETTEIYGFDILKDKSYQTENEREKLEKSLFGSIKMNPGIYLSKINCDLNNDYIIDYSETFDNDEYFIKEWDSDYDNVFDTVYKQNKNDPSQEFIVYFQPVSNIKIQTELKDGIPVSIDDSITVKSVTKGKTKFFYWIGNTILNDAEEQIKEKLEIENVCYVLFDGRRISASKIGNFYFGEVIDEN